MGTVRSGAGTLRLLGRRLGAQPAPGARGSPAALRSSPRQCRGCRGCCGAAMETERPRPRAGPGRAGPPSTGRPLRGAGVNLGPARGGSAHRSAHCQGALLTEGHVKFPQLRVLVLKHVTQELSACFPLLRRL